MGDYLFITEYFWPIIKGGGELNLLEKCRMLTKQGHNVRVMTTTSPGCRSNEMYEGIQIYRVLKTGQNPTSVISNLMRSVLFIRSIHHIFHKEYTAHYRHYEVHLHGTAVLAAPYLKKKIYHLYAKVENLMALCPKSTLMDGNKQRTRPWTFISFVRSLTHDGYIGKMPNRVILKYNPLFWCVIWQRYKKMNNALRCCRVITISKFMQRELLKYGIPSEIEPNYVDETKFKPMNAQLNIIPVVIAFGSFVPYRGFHILDQACKTLNCRLLLYGSGPLDYEFAIVNPPIPYDEVPAIMASADIIVVPSLFPEPEGRVAKEALMMGKKVIVSDIGALHDLERAIKVRPGCVDDLRLKLEAELCKITG